MIFLVAFSLSFNIVYSQNKTIIGRVISEDFETLPMISIMINDTVEVGKTDLDGFFYIEIPISKKNLFFDYPGLELATICINDKCDNIELVMMYLINYDFMSLKRAERKRKKRYKNFLRYIKKLLRKVFLKLNILVIIVNLNLFI
mgnify:CR=1 FL=1